MKHRSLTVAVATLAAAALLAGCSTTPAASPTSSSGGETERERVSLNVGYIDTSINGVGITAVANELDLWEEAGIDVNLTPFTNGPTQIQAMASGSIDVGYIGGGATWLPASGQAKIIVPSESSFGDYLIAQPDSGIEEPADLAGAKIGMPEGGSGEMILALALEDAGLTRDDVEVVPLDPPNVVSAFVAGQIDVAAIFKPLSDQIITSVPDAVVVANNVDFPETEFVGAWVASNQAVTDKAEAVTRFLEVYAQANDFRIENTEDAVGYAAAESGAPAEQLQAQADALEWWPSEEVLVANEDGTTFGQFEALVDLFVDLGRLDEAVPAEEFVNTELFANAMANLQ
jgi:NitT/TauT family transport system substrate-binding protein